MMNFFGHLKIKKAITNLCSSLFLYYFCFKIIFMEKVLSEKITSLSQLDPNGFYSYLDYLSWQFEQRVELIKGKIFPMAAPNRRHQDVSGFLTTTLFSFARKCGCKSYTAPFDVRLYDNQKPVKKNQDFNTVVQPDVCIVCDLKKLDYKGCLGAPDLMVEILSPGNSKKEMDTKKRLYEENGVREYWIINFDYEQVFQFVLNDTGVYNPPIILLTDAILECTIFPDLKINLEELFAA